MRAETWKNLSSASRWGCYFILIGLVAGLGAVLFHFLCEVGFYFFMDMLAGYHPPSPTREQHLFASTNEFWVRTGKVPQCRVVSVE